jgi:transposase-like protein
MKDSLNGSNGSGQRVRRHFSPQQKAAFVKAHLVDKTPLSDLCDKHQIQVAQFYQWQKQLFEHADAAFERQAKKSGKSAHERQIEQLQAKLVNKNEVIAELMEENVKAKKECGEL